MAVKLKALWRGELPLVQAFWEYAILYGALLSAVATGAALVAVANGAPGPLALAIHLAPTPYFLAAAIGVQRSAGHYKGWAIWAASAPPLAYLWAVAMAVI